MAPKPRQRTALLLIAVLAMLPLQGIQAALGSLAGAAVTGMHATGHPHADHDMQQMGGMPDCAMHQPGAGKMPGGSHCNGGCDMCGACSAALPLSLQLQPVAAAGQLTAPVAETRQPARLAYPLFRPPRA